MGDKPRIPVVVQLGGSDVKPEISLYFTQTPLQLERTHVRIETEEVEEFHARRGKPRKTAPRGNGAFEWREGVKSLAILLLRYAAWGLRNCEGPAPVLEGDRESVAGSLDNVIQGSGNAPEWLKEMFGWTADDIPHIWPWVLKHNSGQSLKHLPISISFDPDAVPPENIDVFVDGQLTDNASTLDTMATRIEKNFHELDSREQVVATGWRAGGIKDVGSPQVEPARPSASPIHPSAPHIALLPPAPDLVIGREDDVRDLKDRLGVTHRGPSEQEVSSLVVMYGWPGVGKSTLVSALAQDPEVADFFLDGVLWASLGQDPNLLSELLNWGRALNDNEMLGAVTVKEGSARLANVLRKKRALLIVDDVWTTEHAVPFRVGGPQCALLITTRLPSIAKSLATAAHCAYALPVLTDDASLVLLAHLAPTVVADRPEQCRELVRELEGLPLALQVAGRLLNAESSMRWGIDSLLSELRQEATLLASAAPPDCTDLVSQTIPTVAALLRKSTDRLDSRMRDCFAMLGPFVSKPATFDLDAVAAIWEVEDPKPILRQLVNHGLLEPVGDSRFRMHALLVSHAKSLLFG